MGQINDNTLFGQVITRIAADERYSTICEIGTWNGQGSTRCVMEALHRRTTPFTFYSIEANKEFYTKAVNFWDPCPPSLKLLYGSLHNKTMTRHEVQTHPLFQSIKDHYDLWYDDEHNCATQSPRVTLPVTHIDIVLLDGGEFSTEEDWNILKTFTPNVVILDDTRVIKTSNIRKELLESSEWETLFDVQYERNGWAVFKRREELLLQDGQQVHP
jgi:hypothetical protein